MPRLEVENESRAAGFTIEKNVPVGQRNASENSLLQYPWDKMENGDSVLLPIENGDASVCSRRYYNSAKKWLERHRPNWKPVTRRDGDHIRVWLVGPENE